MRSGKCISTVAAHSDPVTSSQFSPRTGNQIVTSSLDGLVRFWDCRFLFKCYKTLYQVKTNNFVNDRVSVSNVIFTQNEKYILSSTLDHKISLWNVHPPFVEDIKKGTYTSPSSLSCYDSSVVKVYSGHRNDKFCVSSCLAQLSSQEKDMEHNDAQRQHLKQPKHGFEQGQYVITGSEDHKIYIWDLHTGSIVNRLEGHGDVVLSVCCHPTEQVFASCGSSEDKDIRIWKNYV